MNIINTTNIKFNRKIVCFVIIISVFASFVLSACEKPDIYALIENLLSDGSTAVVGSGATSSLYYFTADLNITVNKDNIYSISPPPQFGDDILDSIPDELKFKFDGKVKKPAGKPSEFIINAEISGTDNTGGALKTTIYGKNNLLYFELNDISKVAVNFLCAGGFLDIPVKDIFENIISYENNTVICFDTSRFDLSQFDEYIPHIDRYFKVSSAVKYDGASAQDFSVPDIASFNKSKVAYFKDIKSKAERELLKTAYYRYSELYVILSADNNKNSYINILATRESGEKVMLEKVKIDCDISKIIQDPQLLLSEKIIPMRYILELFGETVSWDEIAKKAYITGKDGKKIFFDGDIIKSKTYISLTQIIAQTNYGLQTGTSGEYIEFKIFRK